MKKRFLPLSLLLVIMMLGQAITFADNGGHYVPRVQGTATADSYMSELRANQHTGLIDPALMIKAAQGSTNVKGGVEEASLYWLSMGPDNFGGQTTAILYDNRPNDYGNSNGVVYIGSKGGGVYKTYNHGITWHQVGYQNLMVSCMVQDADGTIYVGTGDCGAAATYNGLSQLSYDNSFVGNGIYSIVNDEIVQISSTAAADQSVVGDWSFVNDLAIVGNNLVAATGKGLKYSSDKGNTWTVAKSEDGTEILGNAMQVKAMGGKVMAAVDGMVYIGELNAMVCHSDNAVQYDENHSIIALPTAEGLLDIAVAPSNNNVLYASCVNASGIHAGVYVSENQGATWKNIQPSSSSDYGHSLYAGYGLNNHGLVVDPMNEFVVYVMGRDLWELRRVENVPGYYLALCKSNGSSASYTSPSFLHVGLNAMVFDPDTKTREFYVGTNGGIYKGIAGNDFSFEDCNRNYITTRMFSVAYSNSVKCVMGGAQDHGTILIEGDDDLNHVETGRWAYSYGSDNGMFGSFTESYQPGECAFSMVNPYTIFVSGKNGMFKRSETAGADWVSTNFLSAIDPKYLNEGNLKTSSFRFPFALVESFDDAENPVEVWAFNEDTVPAYQVQAMSELGYPFYATLSTPLPVGDSVMVHDPISAKMYVSFTDCFCFTRGALNFSDSPKWYLLTKEDDGYAGDPLSMAVTPDGDKAFIGFKDGKFCRIDNINTVVDDATACLDSAQCQLKFSFFELPTNGQCVTSIAVDPRDFNNVVVTLGNYGNEYYVLYSSDALSDAPTFVSKQGDLPKMPVYSSLIEMTTGKVILGTEHGIYVADDMAEPKWVAQNGNMGDVPVLELKQQLMKHPDQIYHSLYGDITFEGVHNQGIIYAATYGRGLFRCENFRLEEHEDVAENQMAAETTIGMYPNPVSDMAKVSFETAGKANVSCEVYDICGRRIMSRNLGSYTEGNHEVSIDMSGLSAGSYILRLNQGAKSSTVKFMVY